MILIHNISHKVSLSKIQSIKDVASNTVGNSSKYLIDELLSLISTYESLNKEVESIESKIIDIMKQIDSPTASIPGIGLISAATIISEFGDFTRFDSSIQCIAYAGLDVGISQSGTKSFRGKMVKHGSSHLRYALLNVVRTVCVHNDTLKQYWIKKKVTDHKFLRVADSHTAKKLIRIIYYLETHQIKFDSSLCK